MTSAARRVRRIRLPVQLGDVGRPARIGRVRHHPAAAQLDDPVGDAAISRLWVTIDAVAPRWACSWSSSRIWTPVWKSSSPGRLVGEQDRVAGGEGAGDRHPLLLAAGELVREVVDAVAEPDALEHLAGGARALGAGGDVGAELDVLARGQRREQVEGLKDEADRLRGGSGTAPRARRPEMSLPATVSAPRSGSRAPRSCSAASSCRCPRGRGRRRIRPNSPAGRRPRARSR